MDSLSGSAAPGAASADTASAMALQRAGEIGADASQTPNLGTSQAIGWRTPGAFESAWHATKNGVSDVKLSDVQQGMNVANVTSQLVRGGIDMARPDVKASPIAARPAGTLYPGATAAQFEGGQGMTLRQLLAALQQGGMR